MRETSDEPRAPLRFVAFTNVPQVAQGFDSIAGAMGHRLVGLVTTPGPARRRSTSYQEVVRTARPDLDIIITSHPRRLAAMLAPLRPDLILCGSFPWRIPADVIELPRFGAINAHPAALPKHRGPNSVGWALRNGERELGFTIHRMDANFDTGAILAQTTIPIGDDDTTESLLSRLAPLGFALFPEAIARVLLGDPGEPQDESLASDAPLFDEAERVIDWSRSAREVHNLVRSWHGFTDVPRGAITELDGVPTLVTRTRLSGDEQRGAAAPGTIVARHADGTFEVQCGDEPLLVLESQPFAAET